MKIVNHNRDVHKEWVIFSERQYSFSFCSNVDLGFPVLFAQLSAVIFNENAVFIAGYVNVVVRVSAVAGGRKHI